MATMASLAVECLTSRPVRAVPKMATIPTTLTTTTMKVTITATLNDCFAVGRVAQRS